MALIQQTQPVDPVHSWQQQVEQNQPTARLFQDFEPSFHRVGFECGVPEFVDEPNQASSYSWMIIDD